MKAMKLVQGKDQSSWKEHWLDKLPIEQAGIPIIPGIPKDESNDKIAFSTFTRFRGLIEIIRDSNKRFKTMQDVVRAAFYIGINILYRMHEKDIINKGYGEALYAHLRRNETLYQRNQIFDDAVLELKRLTDMHDKGYMTKEEVDENIQEMVSAFPPDIMEDGKKLIRKFISARYDKNHPFRTADYLKMHHRTDQMK